MEHYITQTREELQEQLDASCRLVERLTQAVKTLAGERDEARKQRDKLLASAKIAEDDSKYIAEQCEETARLPIVPLAESRTWKVIARLSREAGNKIRTAISSVEK